MKSFHQSVVRDVDIKYSFYHHVIFNGLKQPETEDENLSTFINANGLFSWSGKMQSRRVVVSDSI